MPVEEKEGSHTAVLEIVRPEKSGKDLGALASIYYPGRVNLSALVQPEEKFLFLSDGKWYSLAENFKSYTPIRQDDIEKLVNEKSRWALLETGVVMPGGKEMYALHQRAPNSNVYKHIA